MNNTLRPLLAAFGLLAALPLFAATPAETAPGTPTIIGDDLRIGEVFSTHLPQTLPASDLRLILHPHLGDLNHRDYLRLTLGLRYGLTDRWEVSAETDFHFSHGLGDLPLGKQLGLSALRLGTKYDLGERLIYGWDTAIGFDFDSPLSRPPVDHTDGLRHYNPYLTSSRRLRAHPDIRLFWGAGVDLVSHTPDPHTERKNQLDDHSTVITAGAVWDRRSLHYTFEMAWASTRLLGQSQEDTLTLRPGVIWEVPWFRARASGRIVLIGAALRTVIGPDGTTVGASAKLRINYDPKAHQRRNRAPSTR